MIPKGTSRKALRVNKNHLLAQHVVEVKRRKKQKKE
jgi:hypothetical protein